ncbi:hypothetical protein HY768_03755 [candidate division TA06 bacterium]|uniref:Ammonium transporter AmtB-like domain-containing protein n=1 Tax=candidate division TA06 bacterium TaxID=2250710 RepID=A0A933MHR1_UNCT6|nr:hypothetical protein [candidate division TA06 bacterium]
MKKILLSIFLLSAAGMAYGQLLETPVPFDSAGKILEWSQKLETRAGLFPDVADFKNAVLWKADTVYILEASNAHGRIRKPLTNSGYDSLRMKVDSFLNTSGAALVLNQEGRGAYLLWQIPLSLGWYGPAVVSLIDPERGSTKAGLYLTSAAATYFIPFFLTKNSTLTSGQEHMSIAYGFRGIAAGGALSALLGLDGSRPISGVMLATSISGQVAGYNWGKSFTKPQGRVISHYATFGMTDLPLFFNAIQEDPEEKLMSAAILAGLAGGSYLGYRLAKGKNFSDGEPTIVATSGWAGMAAGAGLYLCAFSKGDEDLIRIDARMMSTFCFMGSAAGLYCGHRYIKGYNYSRGDGFIVTGTAAGGALFGAGFGFLFAPHDNDVGMLRLITGTATVGMLGGYALGIRTVRNQEHKRLSSLEINFDGVPLGLALAVGKVKTQTSWITGRF